MKEAPQRMCELHAILITHGSKYTKHSSQPLKELQSTKMCLKYKCVIRVWLIKLLLKLFCKTHLSSITKDYYCKPTFICVRKIFARFARALWMRIFVLVDANICRREPVLKYFCCIIFHKIYILRAKIGFFPITSRTKVVGNKIWFTVTYKDCLPWIFIRVIRSKGILRIMFSIQDKSSGWTVLSKSF